MKQCFLRQQGVGDYLLNVPVEEKERRSVAMLMRHAAMPGPIKVRASQTTLSATSTAMEVEKVLHNHIPKEVVVLSPERIGLVVGADNTTLYVLPYVHEVRRGARVGRRDC
jgi:hypothetical protein